MTIINKTLPLGEKQKSRLLIDVKQQSFAAQESKQKTSEYINEKYASAKLEDDDIDIHTEMQINIHLAMNCKLSTKKKLELCYYLLESCITNCHFIPICVDICIDIVKKEYPLKVFFDAIINQIRVWYLTKEDSLRYYIIRSESKWILYLKFLTEFYKKIKLIPFLVNAEENPDENSVSDILEILMKSCVDCIQIPMRKTTEIECLYVLISEVGADLKKKFPRKFYEFIEIITPFTVAESLPLYIRYLTEKIVQMSKTF